MVFQHVCGDINTDTFKLDFMGCVCSRCMKRSQAGQNKQACHCGQYNSLIVSTELLISITNVLLTAMGIHVEKERRGHAEWKGVGILLKANIN